MLVVDRDGRITQANRAVYETFGWEPGSLVGQPVEVLVPERFRPYHRGYREEYQRHPSQRATRPMGLARELCGLRTDGSEFPIRVWLIPVGKRLVIG